jgi:RsiW-degrading membrane proteinase PrsW (M82 family)
MSLLVGLYICLVAAVIPTIGFVLLIYWADRYEREPWWLVAVAFLWGAIPAVVVSAVAELILGLPLASDNPTLGAEVIESALFAPVVEELAKGVALLALFLWARAEFDDVLDGLVYGALIGFGFAMTENLFYFIGAFSEGGYASLTVIFVLRVLLFGLNHAFFTGLTGIGFGLARSASSRRMRRLWPLVGLMAAILAHATHNFGASIADINVGGIILSLLVALGGLITILLTVLLSWQQERTIIRTELASEVGSLLSDDEYQILTRRWRNPLRKRKADRTRMSRLQQLVELALHKARLRQMEQSPEAWLVVEIDKLRTHLAQSM